MHQTVGELPVGGEQQQTGSVDVQSPDRDPAPGPRWRQAREHRRSPLGVTAGGPLADWLVIKKELALRQGCTTQVELAPVQAHLVTRLGAFAEPCGASVDRHTPCADPALHAASRSKSRTSKEL